MTAISAESHWPPLSLEDVRHICGGAWASTPIPEKPITDLSTDTRSGLSAPAQTLFVALSGSKRSGADFLPQAYAQGIRAFMLSAPPQEPLPPDAAVIIVSDVRAALQDLAHHRRQQFTAPVIAITGSNGKTVVKEWLYEILSPDRKVLRSPKSYNSQVGVPLSVWLLQPVYELAIFEAGISGMGEMARLERILEPQIGLFLNVGEAHQAGFESRLQKAVEKALLFQHCPTLFYCADYPEITEAFRLLGYLDDPKRTLISWSLSGNEAAHWQVYPVEREEFHTRFHISGKGEEGDVLIPFNDDASLENAVYCWLVGRHLGVSAEVLSERMMRLHPVAMRLELRKGTNDCTLLNDAYNSDLTSLRIALTALQNQSQHPHKSIILSDLLQSGVIPETLYASVATLLRGAALKRFIGIGPELLRHQALFSGLAAEVYFFENTSAFFRALPEIRFEDEAILLKGARSFAFERIVALLEQEVHRTVLTIDLAALKDNLRTYRQLLPQRVKLMVMVKAFGYGSGSHEIAAVLQESGVDYLAVAYTDEGVALREKGIRLPIMVMSPDVGSFERLIAWKLEPEIFSFRSLAAFTRAAQTLGITGYPVHLKLNTGMNRLGFDTADVPRLIEQLGNNNTLYLRSIFSHLAGAEDARLDAFTEQQAAVFRRNAAAIRSAVQTDAPLLHLSNSSGIARHPQYQFDMVRLGLGIYGIDSTARNLALRPVSSLHTTIAQLRRVPAGEGVSYGHGGVSDKDRLIATVCLGYADGYPRALGHGKAYMRVRGRKAYTVGTVCMDMCMLDVTHIPAVREGDEVLVFGPELSPVLLAQWAETIPYEILTGISHRVKRIYLNEL